MLRYVLIGLGVITTALTGYYAKRKLSKRLHTELDRMFEEPTCQPTPAAKGRKSRGSQFRKVMENGELTTEA